MEIIFLIGRILFGGVFLLFGVIHFKEKKHMISWIKTKDVAAPALANFMAGSILLFSGLLLILGVFPDVALTLLIIFLIAASLLMHDFWNIKKDRKERMNQIIYFMYNMALIGASAMLIWINFWPLSL